MVEPTEAVFVDDNPKNVAAAEKLGITAIVYETYPQLVTDLKQLGVKV